MNNTQHRQVNFVAAEPQTIDAAPGTSLLRRQDVVQAVDGVINAYSQQQKALLAQVQGDAIEHTGFLSDAAQVAERRRTSRMYLITYAGVSGLTMAGLAFLAWLAGVAGVAALAGWMAGTGITTLLLAWRRHGDEFAHSPEGIARHLLDWHGEIASYESETRRLSLQWEHEAERRRQEAANDAAGHARRLAELRIAELDARRRTVEAQTMQRDTSWIHTPAPERRFAVQWQTDEQTVIDVPGTAVTAIAVSTIDDGDEALAGGATCDSWHAVLVRWIASLYEGGATGENGVIKGRVPWAARSTWLESDKTAARRVCCELRPKLIEAAAGGRWRLRTEMFPDAEQALALLSQRLS